MCRCSLWTVKYLGITLDRRLHWNLHVQDRVAKAKKFLMKMANLAKATWGPKPKLMRWVFRCVVRPMIVYGSVVWAHEANRPKYSEMLRHVNRMAICTYTKFPRSTPTRMLEIATDTFPLHLYLVKEALCAFIRLFSLMGMGWSGYNRNINFSTSHRRRWLELLVEYNVSGYECLDTCFEINQFHDFSVHEESFHDASFVEKLPYASWQIYTDGSKLAGRVGAAYVILCDGQVRMQGQVRLSDSTSVFQAEVFGIGMAATAVCELDRSLGCCFYVDSQSALLALKASTIESGGVLSTVLKLNDISGRVDLVWVKAHAGNVHNDAVDALAKAATELTEVSEHLVSRQYIRNVVLDKLRAVWDVEWLAYPKARQSKQFFMSQDKVKAKEIYSLSRYQLGRLIRVTSGHNQLKYHQHVIYPHLSSLCRYCLVQRETFAHWVHDCPAFDADRQSVFAGPSGVFSSAWKVDELLRFAALPRVRSALSHYDPESNASIDSGSNAPESDVDMSLDEVDSERSEEDDDDF